MRWLPRFGNRKATQDIDVVIATNDRRIYQTVQQAIALVAKENNLPSAWLNDDVTIVVDQIGKPKAPKHWKTFDTLVIYVPELEYILALKLFSGRPQDDRDILAIVQRLAISTKTQAWSIVNYYIPDTQFRLRSEYTTQAIDRCFPKIISSLLMFAVKHSPGYAREPHVLYNRRVRGNQKRSKVMATSLLCPIHTIADAASQIDHGEDPWFALGYFLHDWWCYAVDQRQELICASPSPTTTLEGKRCIMDPPRQTTC